MLTAANTKNGVRVDKPPDMISLQQSENTKYDYQDETYHYYGQNHTFKYRCKSVSITLSILSHPIIIEEEDEPPINVAGGKYQSSFARAVSGIVAS
jgi:hypothetical protein